MEFIRANGIEDLGPYRIHSRREIISILGQIRRQNQLVRMIFNKNSEAIVTSILDVDESNDSVVLDCALDEAQNKRVLGSDNLSFETVLDNIRVVFFANYVEGCEFEDRFAFRIPLPSSLIRLQRREYYRVKTPNCQVTISFETEPGNSVSVTASLRDLSVGGIGILDDTMQLDATFGHIYNDCRIQLSDGQVIGTKLQVRNAKDVRLPTGKLQRRIGFQFVSLPNSMLLALQRFITKVERERNAKQAGLV